MTSFAIRSPSLFVSTIASPSKAASLGLSPISTTTAKPTETPKKLKNVAPETNNNDEEDGVQQGIQRSDSWTSRAGFSPRPTRANNNPARRPVQSGSPIRVLRLAEQNDEIEKQKSVDREKEAIEALGRSNQSHLDRIQEADGSDDETENGSQEDSDENVDEYDGDGEDDDDALQQLYKSFSGDLVVRYTAGHRSHSAFDNDDDDIVRI